MEQFQRDPKIYAKVILLTAEKRVVLVLLAPAWLRSILAGITERGGTVS